VRLGQKKRTNFASLDRSTKTHYDSVLDLFAKRLRNETLEEQMNHARSLDNLTVTKIVKTAVTAVTKQTQITGTMPPDGPVLPGKGEPTPAPAAAATTASARGTQEWHPVQTGRPLTQSNRSRSHSGNSMILAIFQEKSGCRPNTNTALKRALIGAPCPNDALTLSTSSISIAQLS